MKNSNTFIITSLLCSIIILGCKGQNIPKVVHDSCLNEFDSDLKMVIYSQVDEMPKYKGGNEELVKFITKNIDLGKAIALKRTFLISIVIDTSGNILEKKIENKIELDLSPEEEEKILEPFKNTPLWSPGKCNGLVVPVRFYIPIKL